MRIILERHTYAPELNKAYIGPSRVMMPAPGCASIADVRRKLFAPLKNKGRFVILRAQNVREHKNLDRERAGFCNDLHSLAEALRVFRQYHNLPGCRHIVKTQLIG